MTPESLTIIFLLALCVYLMRISGVWLIRRFEITPEMEKVLGQLPGIVLAAVLAPAVMKMGIIGLPALLITGIIAAKSGNLVLSTIVGTLTFIVFRLYVK